MPVITDVPRPTPLIWIGIFLLSGASLMFEVALTRLLSITDWHHFAFLIISGALLGYGAAGSWFMRFRRPRSAFSAAFCFGIGIVPLFFASRWLPFDPALLPIDSRQWLYLIGVFLLLSVPFFLVGLVINRLLRHYPAHTFYLYGFDLLGAATGCAGFFVIAARWDETGWLVIVAMIGLAGALSLAHRRRDRVLSAAALAISAGVLVSSVLPPVTVSPYKSLSQALRYPGAELLDRQWDARSRIDWFFSPMARFAPGLSLSWPERLPPQIGMTIDGDRLTAFTIWRDEAMSFLDYLPSAMMYRLPPPPQSVLVLNVIGGLEAAGAIQGGVPEITVQSEYPLAARWLSQQAGYRQLTFHAEQARTFLAEDRGRYDRILVSLEGALPTGGTGMHVLQPSTLLTVEGVESLLDHLSADGWLAFHRYLLPPPRAELRLVSTLLAAARSMGLEPETRLGVFRSVSTFMVVFSAQEWTDADRAVFRRFCRERDFDPVYYPGMHPSEANRINRFPKPIYAREVGRLLSEPEVFHRESLFDLTPVYDDRPFFYHFLRYRHLEAIYQVLDRKWEAMVEAGLLLPLALAAVMLLSALLIGLPFLGRPLVRRRPTLGPVYFLLIGVGFMATEIVFLEKLSLFLGDPTRSFAVVLASLLLAAGIGSILAHRLPRRLVGGLIAGLVMLLLLYGWQLSSVLGAFSGSPLSVRVAIAVVVVAVPGVWLGMPFPLGLSAQAPVGSRQTPAATDQAEYRVSLAWALNAFASVTGATGAMLLAQLSGFSGLFVWSAAAYLLAYPCYRRLQRVD